MGKLTFPVQCTSCNWTQRVLAEIMHSDNSVKCDCGNEIRFNGDMRKAQKEYEIFQQALRDIATQNNKLRTDSL